MSDGLVIINYKFEKCRTNIIPVNKIIFYGPFQVFKYLLTIPLAKTYKLAATGNLT